MYREIGEGPDPAEWFPGIVQQIQPASLDLDGVATLLEDAGALLMQPRSMGRGSIEQLFIQQVGQLAQKRGSHDGAGGQDSPSPGPRKAELRQVYQRFLETLAERQERLQRERAEAGSLLEELRQQPGLRRKWLVRNIRRFQSFGLAEHILEEMWRMWHNDPREAVSLSEIALEISEQLSSERYGAGLINDLRARCLAALANSRRVLGHRSNVEEVFQAARYYLDRGTGNPTEQAYFLQLQGSWRRSQGRTDEAVELLKQAAVIHRQLGLRDREANVMIQMALFVGSVGRYDEAMEILERVQNDFRDLDPRLIFYAHHNYTATLVELGRYEQGLERIAEGRRMAEQLGDRLDEQRVNWLEGQLLAKVGRLEEAEALLREARDHFLGSGKGLEAVGPALDLIRLRLQLSQGDESEIAQELLSFFPSREVQQNILSALLHLSKALQKGEADLELVDQVEAFLERAQANPSAVFEPADRA